METFSLVLYFIASWGLFLFVPMIFVDILLGGALRVAARNRTASESDSGRSSFAARLVTWFLAVAFILALVVSVLALINIISPHAIDGHLVYTYGKKTDAKVLNKEGTNNTFNDRQVERYNVIYRTESGETVETYFETSDFNIYPPANSVRYPLPGQNFRIAYLPSYPTAFLILTEEKSEYQATQRCAEILRDIEQKRNKYQFDKKNLTFLSEYVIALSEGIQQECGPGLSDELRSIDSGKAR